MEIEWWYWQAQGQVPIQAQAQSKSKKGKRETAFGLSLKSLTTPSFTQPPDNF